MILTPEEAKTKMCPLSFNRADVAADRTSHAPDFWNCSADGCMAWRWQHAASHDNPSRVPGAGKTVVKTERGWCGMGHKP